MGLFRRIRWLSRAAPVFISIAFSCPQAYSQAQPDTRSTVILPSAPNSMNYMRRRVVAGRYELRNASLVDLIGAAWNIHVDDVIGGPEWLDNKRFDVSIPVPQSSTTEQLRSILQSMLVDRFHLAVHNTTRNVPVFAMTVDNKALAAKAVTETPQESEDSGCRQPPGPSAALVVFECRNLTLAKLAEGLPRMRATGYLFNYRVVDRTGLDGPRTFTVKWTPRDSWSPRAPSAETISIFDAFEKQLGLKLALGSVAEPAIAVDKVGNQPRANLPGVSAAAQAALRFEVAAIKPSLSPPPCSSVSIEPGGRVRIVMTLKGLIQEAWGDIDTNRVLGGPKNMESTCYEVLAKAPVEEGFGAGWDGPVWNGLDVDSMRNMLRALLTERFKLAAHMDQRIALGYVITSARPKLRGSDPSRRPGCGAWLPDDGKDPRIQNPVASSLLTCHNVTMAQLASALYEAFHEVSPVVDETGLKGRYDFSIHFTPPGAFEDLSRTTAGDVAPEPNGAISVSDALSGQLGLRLRSRRMPASVLVIDSVDETPTGN